MFLITRNFHFDDRVVHSTLSEKISETQRAVFRRSDVCNVMCDYNRARHFKPWLNIGALTGDQYAI